MTREILFRGRISKNEWVYGLPIEGEPLMGRGKETCIVTKPGLSYYDGVLMTYDECVEVDPDTIGQFTGLTDRNGTKIFEGDVVKFKYFDDWIGKIEYDSDSALFTVIFADGDDDYFGRVSCGDCEVIGNIYDNPELLEVSKSD
mgnify:CR=1 FL=1